MQNEILSFKKYDFIVKSKDSISGINYKELLSDFCRIKKIEIDTIQEKREVYVLNVRDWDKILYKGNFSSNLKDTMVTTLYALCNMLSEPPFLSTEKLLDVIPQKDIKDKTIAIDFKLVSNDTKFNERLKILDSCYSITLTKKDTLISIIRIREK